MDSAQCAQHSAARNRDGPAEMTTGKVAELTTEEGKWWAGRVTELAWPEGQGMRKWDNRPQTAPLRSANKTQAERAG